VAVVRLDVNRAFEEERFVKTVELLLDGVRGLLGPGEFLTHCCLPRFPDLQHGFLQ
jgi:hypothetical protein